MSTSQETDEWAALSQLSCMWTSSSSSSSGSGTATKNHVESKNRRNEDSIMELVDGIRAQREGANFVTIIPPENKSNKVELKPHIVIDDEKHQNIKDLERRSIVSEVMQIQLIPEDFELFQEWKAFRQEVNSISSKLSSKDENCNPIDLKQPPQVCSLINTNQHPPSQQLLCQCHSKVPTDHTSDISLKNYVLNQTFAVFEKPQCDKSCHLNKNCLRTISIPEVVEARQKYWGKRNEPAPTRTQRSQKNNYLLHTHFDGNSSTKFKFLISGKEVCESTYLIILGLKLRGSDSKVSKSWTSNRLQYTDPQKYKDLQMEKDNKADKNVSSKTDHVIKYLRFAANELGEYGVGANIVHIKMLPYETDTEVFDEYIAHNTRLINLGLTHPNEVASLSTFREAFKILKKDEIRLRGAKGSFNTCTICNNLHDAIKNTKLEWTDDQLEMVLKLKRLHLNQQAREREDLDQREMNAATKTVDSSGNPASAVVVIDGYSEFQSLTPKQGHMFTSKEAQEKRISNRLIGCKITCGPIQKKFFNYFAPDLTAGGANLTIEVMNKAIEDLSNELAKLGRKLPRKISFQFDNCGENKNKFVFTYLNLLVERKYFDVIQVNFLIVGHTHGPIDQYFSTRSKIRKKTHFIGSPLSLRNLFHDHQCLVSRELTVLHDWKAWLKPVVNKKLHYYSLPHVFIFKMEPTFNRAVCQYKQFSQNTIPWLPKEPPVIAFKNDIEKENEFKSAIANTDQSFLSKNKLSNLCAGGLNALTSSVLERDQGSLTITSIVQEDSNIANRVNQLQQLMPSLIEIEANSIFESEIAFKKQSNDGIDSCDRFKPQATDLILIGEEMKKVSTEEFGFIIWLDNLAKNPSFFESSPSLIDHYTNQQIMESLPSNDDDDDDDDDDEDDYDDDEEEEEEEEEDNTTTFKVATSSTSTSSSSDVLQQNNEDDEYQENDEGNGVDDQNEEVMRTGDTYLAYQLARKARTAHGGILSKITTIVQTAKYVVDHVKKKYDGWCVQDKRDEPEFYYKSGLKRLTRKEYLYYLKRRTARGVLAEIHKDAIKIMEKYHNPFNLIPLATMPENVKEGILERQRQHEETTKAIVARLEKASYKVHGDAFSKKDVMIHAYPKKKKKTDKKKDKNVTKITTVLCQVVGCQNYIKNHNRCRKKDCIGQKKLMCVSHGPKHELHSLCQWKDDSESTTIASSSSSVVEVSNLTPAVQQFLKEQLKSALTQSQETSSSSTAVLAAAPSSSITSINTTTNRQTRKRKFNAAQ